jgi:hypothetical protein
MSTVNYTSLLGLALPTQGDLSGQWGTEVNNYITTYLDSAVAGQLAISLTGNLTLTKTTGSSLGSTSSQYAILNVTPSASTWTITVPAASKTYYINNLSSTYTFTIKASGQTGFVVAAAEKCVVAYNGTDFVRVGSTSVFGAPSTAMSIDTSGNLGLGVTPSAWASSARVFQIRGSAFSEDSGAYLTQNAYENSGWKYYGTGLASTYRQSTGTHAWFNAPSGTAGNAITFTQAMTLDASGNLGLGVTPSAWYPGGKFFQLNGDVGFTGTNNNSLRWNNYINSAGNADIYVATGRAAKFEYDVATGAFKWSQAASGAQGGTITFTQAMTLDSSGNLGIGTSSPGAKLDVQGGSSAIITRFIGGESNYTIRILNTANTGGGSINANTGAGSGITLSSDSGPMIFYAASSERMRLDLSGNLLVGTTSGTDKLTVDGGATFKTGSTSVLGIDYTNASNSYGSAIARILGVSRNTVTGRSIGADGTINASGADYAEYMTKAGDFTITKGDVVGINSDGKLTNSFVDAVSFVVKSTDPSYVGNDKWGVGFKEDAEGLEVARQKVDRIAFAGQVPVNVIGAVAGQYIIPFNDNGAIRGQAISNPTFEQYQQSVGKVIAIEQDGRARIIVKVA